MTPTRLTVVSAAIVAGALVLAHPGPRRHGALGSGDAFTDEVTRLSLAKPAGWSMATGQALALAAEGEARRLGDTRLAPAGDGSTELLVRFTRYVPGEAPGPNPTIVVTRFDMRRFPPRTRADDLLRIGIASARTEGPATTLELGRRPWRMMTASRELSRPDGAIIDTLQEIYVTAGVNWGLAIVISATRPQFAEYRSIFDTTLRTVRFR